MLNTKLKELRKQRKITQEDLAVILGVERSSIGKYESPTRPVIPSIEILVKISQYFDISLDELLTESQDQIEKKPAAHTDSELMELFESMPAAKQEEALRYLRYLADQAAKQK